ncbi:MAG: hypothetical protein WCJ01_11990 [Ignavibacteria bacterium]
MNYLSARGFISGKNYYILLSALLIISEAFYLWIYTNLNEPVIKYFTTGIINSFVFLFIVLMLRSTKQESVKLTRIIIGAAIIFRLTVLFLPPTASDDINRYIWDGKVLANRINPYQYAPADKHLEHLHSALLPHAVNFPAMKTIYPPFAQLTFFISYSIFGESYTGYKMLLLVFEILTILLLVRLLRLLKLPSHYAGIYALCPLPIMQFMIDGHVDAIGLPILILSLIFFFNNKRIWFYIISGFSISTKLISGMLLPYTIDKLEKPFYKKIVMSLIPLSVFAITYLPFLNNHVSPFESLGTFTANWAFNGSFFTLFYNLLPDNHKARMISGLLFLTYGAYLYFSRKETTDKIYLIFLSFLLLSPTVHPWYVNWLAVLLPLSFRWSGFALVTMINMANWVVIDYKLKGIWQMSNYTLLIEYTPVFALIIYEIILYNFNRTKKQNPAGH